MGLQQCLAAVAQATTDDFEEAVRVLEEAKRMKVVRWMSELRSKLHECLLDKMSFWNQIPWRVLGVFWCCLTDDVDAVITAKQILRECITLYQVVIFEGVSASLHRVAKILLDPGKPCGKELREWLESDRPLKNFVNAYLYLLAYCLIPIVERRIEAEHARIKKILRHLTFVVPATLCSLLRESVNLELLRSNEFFEYCVKNWHRHNIVDMVLRQRKRRRSLKACQPPRR